MSPKKTKIEADNKNAENKSSIFNQEGELVVDVYETSSDFVITSAIAGVAIKDIDISVDKDMMIIKGQRPEPETDFEKKFFYQECYWGPFSRKVVLPMNIDIDNTSAEMEKGVLTIKIPKLPETKKEKPNIKIS